MQSQHINTFFYDFFFLGGGLPGSANPKKLKENIEKKKVHLVWHHHPDYAGLQRVAMDEDL